MGFFDNLFSGQSRRQRYDEALRMHERQAAEYERALMDAMDSMPAINTPVSNEIIGELTHDDDKIVDAVVTRIKPLLQELINQEIERMNPSEPQSNIRKITPRRDDGIQEGDLY